MIVGSGWVHSGKWEVGDFIQVIGNWAGSFQWLWEVGWWVHSGNWEVDVFIPVIVYSGHMDWDVRFR